MWGHCQPCREGWWPTSLALALGPDQGPRPVPHTAGLSGLASLALLTPKELQVCLLLVTSLQQILESGCKGFVSTEDTKQGERGPNVMEIEASVEKVPAPCETGGVGTAPVHLLIHTEATAGLAWGCQGTAAVCEGVSAKLQSYFCISSPPSVPHAALVLLVA